MDTYNRYIVISDFNKSSICGQVHLPYGTICYAYDGFLYCSMGKLCAITSQNAYDYFSQDDDGNGLIRGKIVKKILDIIQKSKSDNIKNAAIWNAIINDTTCRKYKRTDFNDFWIWNYEFYNANLQDLEHIMEVINNVTA